MLNIFRQRQTLVKAVFGVILFLVVVSMAITLIPGLGGDIGDQTNNPVLAEVAGDKVTEFEVQQSLQQVSQRNKIPPEMMPFYTNQILNEIVLEKASMNEATRLGLTVDESELREQLKRDPNLFPNGGFVGLDQYENIISEKAGMSVAQFEERYRQAMLLEKLREFITDSIVVSPEEVRKTFLAEGEKIVVDYVALNPDDYKKEITPSDSALEDYFKTNKDRYRVPDKRSAKILFLDSIKAKAGVTITDADRKKYYQDHLDSYRVPERVSVQHILFKADPKNPAELEQARKKAEDALKKLKAGGDFTAMAKQLSDDKGSAPLGGFLINVVRKQTVPEFEKVAFSLAPGAMSDLVSTQFGIHIIKSISHEQAHLQTLEEVRAAIIDPLLQQEKGNKIVADTADKASRELAKDPLQIEAIAAKYQAEVLAPPPFTQNENIPRVGASGNFMQEVFGLEKNHAGPAMEVPGGYAVPVLLDILPAHPAALSEVKDQVKIEYINEQSRAKATSKAMDLAKALEQQETKDIKKASKSLGLTVKTSPPLTRDGTIPSVGPVKDLSPKIASMPPGAVDGPANLQGFQVVFEIVSREPPNDAEFAVKKAEVQARLLNEKRRLAFDVFQDSLKKKMISSGDLKFHQDAIAKLTAATNPKP